MQNPFYVQPANPGAPIMEGIGNILQSKQNLAKKEADDKILQQGAALLQGNDTNAIAEYMLMNPEYGQRFVQAANLQDTLATKSRVDLAKDVITGSIDARQAYSDRLSEIEAGGGSAPHLREALSDPNADLSSWALKDLSVMAPEVYKSYMSGVSDDRGGVGIPSPKDFTVDSLLEYSQSGDISRLKRYRSQITNIAGVPHQYNQETQAWEPIADIAGSEMADQTDALADIEAKKQERLDFAKNRSAWKKDESKLISKIESSVSKNDVMKNTIREAKDAISGWSTKYGAKLSSWPASEAGRLKGYFNTIKANSAFSTLMDLKDGGGTLGAISAPELVLLESAMGELNQSGQVGEMIRVMDQIGAANDSSVQRLKNAYAMDSKKYGGEPPEASQAAQEIDESLFEFMTPEERALFDGND